MGVVISSLTPRELLDTNSKRGGALINGIITVVHYIIWLIISYII